jgi:hypothetical protein
MNKRNLLVATLLTLILAGPSLSISHTAAATPAGNDLSLTVGLILYTGDPDECGTETDLEVNIADNVNICYTMTNNSNETLYYQSLTDSVDGPLLEYEPITLEPGDIISTGTPPGVGFAREPKVFMKPGDVVEAEVESIGLLRNTIGPDQNPDR